MKKFLLSVLCVLCLACEKKTSLDGEYVMLEAPENAEITLMLDGTNFSGQAAINRYFGSFEQNGSTISFKPAGSTMMAGPENLMRVESEYLQGLEKISSWQLENGKLVLSNGTDLRWVFEKQ